MSNHDPTKIELASKNPKTPQLELINQYDVFHLRYIETLPPEGLSFHYSLPPVQFTIDKRSSCLESFFLRRAAKLEEGGIVNCRFRVLPEPGRGTTTEESVRNEVVLLSSASHVGELTRLIQFPVFEAAICKTGICMQPEVREYLDAARAPKPYSRQSGWIAAVRRQPQNPNELDYYEAIAGRIMSYYPPELHQQETNLMARNEIVPPAGMNSQFVNLCFNLFRSERTISMSDALQQFAGQTALAPFAERDAGRLDMLRTQIAQPLGIVGMGRAAEV